MPHQLVTLGDLSSAGNKLCVYCLNCQGNRFFDPASRLFHSDYAAPNVGRRLNCSRCGSWRIHSKPEWWCMEKASGQGKVGGCKSRSC